jgi:hypothetical protein
MQGPAPRSVLRNTGFYAQYHQPQHTDFWWEATSTQELVRAPVTNKKRFWTTRHLTKQCPRREPSACSCCQQTTRRKHILPTQRLCHLHQYSHHPSSPRNPKHAWHLCLLPVSTQACSWLPNGSPRGCQWSPSSRTQNCPSICQIQSLLSLSKGTIDWPKNLSDEHARMVYNEHLLSLKTPNMDYNNYQEMIF